MDVSFHPAAVDESTERRRGTGSAVSWRPQDSSASVHHQSEVSQPFGVDRSPTRGRRISSSVWTELSVGTTLVPLAGCSRWSGITPIVKLAQNGVHRVGRCRAVECPPAAEHFVDDRAERKDASGRRADVPSSFSAPMIRAVCSRRILGTRPTPRVPPIGYSG
jgi:hypothetical protein